MNSSANARAIKKIAIVAPSAARLLDHMGPLLHELIARRHRLLCLAPQFPDPVFNEFSALGIECETFKTDGHRLRRHNETATLKELTAQLKLWRPHITLSIGGRTALWGTVAASRARVAQNICMFEGLAGLLPHDLPPPPPRANAARSTFAGIWSSRNRATLQTKITRRTTSLRRRALRSSHVLLLHNLDDFHALNEAGLLTHQLAVYILAGHGVDLDHYFCPPLPSLDEGLVFAMAATFQRRKGVEEFCAAARKLAEHGASARFILAPIEGESFGADKDDLSLNQIAADYPFITILDPARDQRPVLHTAHVLVQPSHYGEGLPQILMQALATGRPLITSDIAGCRNTVDERVNGCLVRPGDVDALAEAMMSFLRRPDLIASMARASRSKAERHFDVKTVNAELIDIIQLD